MNKNIGILSIIIGILIFIRCIFEKSDKIIYIVAGINIVAIIFVIYTIVERVLHNIIAKIEKSRGLGNDIISILALGISVLDDEIVRKITENYRIWGAYKWKT